MSETPLLDALRERRLLKLWRRWRAEGGIVGFLERQKRMSEILILVNQVEQTKKHKKKEPFLMYIS